MPSEFPQKFSSELESALSALAQRGQCRTLREIPGVNLCSNDYLGLAQSPRLREAVAEGVAAAERVGSTGSRLLSGHDRAWDDLEESFAEFVGTESALFFTSGYAANLGLLTSLAGPDDVVFSDALNHASLIDGIRLSGARKHIYPHADLNALEFALRKHQNDRARKLIVTETVFSMDGDAAPLREIYTLAARYGAGVILDEAHATAVHGPQGRGLATGLYGFAGAENVVAIVHTCGKALASAGAFVCGSALLKEYLVNRARSFLFSTALPPYMAAQVHEALRLAQSMDAERAALQQSAKALCAALRQQGWDTASSNTQIIPVIIGENAAAVAAAAFLQRAGFAVRAIRPPTVPQGTARLRLSLTSAITQDELTRLADALQAFRGEFVSDAPRETVSHSAASRQTQLLAKTAAHAAGARLDLAEDAHRGDEPRLTEVAHLTGEWSRR
jgi:8-amino-7-oxononanoate synthase